jgi:hypothetical protein
MKKTTPLAIIALFFILTASKCKKDPVSNPIDQLPPATQTGANTFGCLVNGQAFTPGGSSLSGPDLAATYQYLIPGTPAGYVFNVFGVDKRNTGNITSVGFEFDSVFLAQGIYPLAYKRNGQGGQLIFIMPVSPMEIFFLLLKVYWGN